MRVSQQSQKPAVKVSNSRYYSNAVFSPITSHYSKWIADSFNYRVLSSLADSLTLGANEMLNKDNLLVILHTLIIPSIGSRYDILLKSGTSAVFEIAPMSLHPFLAEYTASLEGAVMQEVINQV